MQLTITNTGPEAEALGDPGGDYLSAIEPGATLEFDGESQVLIFGDKPTIREQFAIAAERLGDMLRAIITAIAGRKSAKEQAGEALEYVTASVVNRGPNPVRAINGDGVTEQTISPGASTTVSALGYVEFRELGQLDPSQVDGGTQPAAA